MNIETVESTRAFEFSYPVVIVGGGACGLCAAIAASDNGKEVLLLEQDDRLLGTTGMSTGLIPAAGTPEQASAGIEDSADVFSADIQNKAQNNADQDLVYHLAQESAETVAWLRDTHGVPLTLLDGFTYPGHSAKRMYGTPGRSGAELMVALESAAIKNSVDILTSATVEDLFVDAQHKVLGVRTVRPDGETEEIGCDALILACCGFAGNSEMIDQYIPEMSNATFHGHPGNKGHAIKWGESMGAELADMGAYQGHGGLASGHGIPILWPLIMEGGFQVNKEGRRFSDESKGYSEQAVNVISQTNGVAWSMFDQRLYAMMMQFEDFRGAVEAGAISKAESVEDLADLNKLPREALLETFADVQACVHSEKEDEFGRVFNGKPALKAPYYSAKVTGALFHTQGGLAVNVEARVLKASSGQPFPNLFAGGGAARGISGNNAAGYIAGNGLLTATSLGKIAGRCAANMSD